MFGTFRFILAAFVALSHFGVTFAGINPGNEAVICFYVLSGLLMERQFKKLSRGGNGKRAFYLDRFLRIYPLYLTVLALAFMLQPVSGKAALSNIALLPLDYSLFTGVPRLIEISWSVALEMHFYVLVPLLVLCSTRALRVVLLFSILVFAISPFFPYSTFWGYTALPGMLFTFVSGMLINRRDVSFLKVPRIMAFFLLVLFGLSKIFRTGLLTGIHINVCLGYLVALTAIPALDKFSQNMKWDRMLGLFSYPLFLCHCLVADFVRRYLGIFNTVGIISASILFAGILILTVEMPFDYLRYRMRGPSRRRASDVQQSTPEIYKP